MNIGESVISIKDLHKKYKKKSALNRISFDIYHGEVVGFIGPNGAGKTTTIKLICGLINIDEGEIKINNSYRRPKDMNHIPGICYVPDIPSFFENLSGFDYLTYFNDSGDKANINKLAKQFGLIDIINDKIITYSLGMKKKLAIAMACLGKPSCIVMDEPFSGIDPIMLIELRDIVQNLKQEGFTIFLSSHQLGELENLCDRYIMLNKGNIIYDGSSDALHEQYIKVPVLEIIDKNPDIIPVFKTKKNMFFFQHHRTSLIKLIEPTAIQQPTLEDLFLIKMDETKIDMNNNSME